MRQTLQSSSFRLFNLGFRATLVLLFGYAMITTSFTSSTNHLNLIDDDCSPYLTIRNNGNCAVNIYHWVSNGDIYFTTIQAGSEWTTQTGDGEKWRALDIVNDWQNLQYDEHYMLSGCHNQTWNISPSYCGTPGDFCLDGLLENPSFENGVNGWYKTGGNFSTGSSFAVDGHRNAFFYSDPNWTNKVYQVIDNVLDGNEYNLNFYAGVHHTGYNHRGRLAFYNNSDQIIGSDQVQIDYDVDNGSGLQEYNLTVVAPAGSAYAAVEFLNDGDYIKIDAVCLSTSNTNTALAPPPYLASLKKDEFRFFFSVSALRKLNRRDLNILARRNENELYLINIL